MTELYESPNAAAKAYLEAQLPGYDLADLPNTLKQKWNTLSDDDKWALLKTIGVFRTQEEKNEARLKQIIATLKVGFVQLALSLDETPDIPDTPGE